MIYVFNRSFQANFNAFLIQYIIQLVHTYEQRREYNCRLGRAGRSEGVIFFFIEIGICHEGLTNFSNWLLALTVISRSPIMCLYRQDRYSRQRVKCQAEDESHRRRCCQRRSSRTMQRSGPNNQFKQLICMGLQRFSFIRHI